MIIIVLKILHNAALSYNNLLNINTNKLLPQYRTTVSLVTTKNRNGVLEKTKIQPKKKKKEEKEETAPSRPSAFINAILVAHHSKKIYLDVTASARDELLQHYHTV